jgi:lipoprotein-anchoring transpeptidase ErfK/SrfK
MSTAEIKANGEVISARSGWWRPDTAGKKALLIGGILTLLLLIAGGAAAYVTYDFGQEYEGRIFPGTTVAGVDLSGMTRSEALAEVKATIEPQLTREISLTWKKKEWTTSPQELGARSNAKAAVTAAVAASRNASFLDQAQMKLLGEDMDFTRSVAITKPRKGAKELVASIAKDVNVEPVDAGIDYSTGWVEITQHRVGHELQADKATAALTKNLKGGSGDAQLALPVKTTQPETTADEFDQVLLTRIGENKLYLYENGEITHEWTVATGLPEYPTPTGLWEVTELRYMPTWVNPDPTGWGASMPASIPPGPGNPLGVRAINWSAPAIRFHGTDATYSLGYNASHGCVRMSNSDVIELYDMIEVGTPIVSVQAGPNRPLYSAPAEDDPTVVADSGSEGEKKENG